MPYLIKTIVLLFVFLTGCLVGSIVEVQGRGLDGQTIEQCATLMHADQRSATQGAGTPMRTAKES